MPAPALCWEEIPSPQPRTRSRNVNNALSPHAAISELLTQQSYHMAFPHVQAAWDLLLPVEQDTLGSPWQLPAACTGILNGVHEVCLTSMMCATESQRNRHLK